jgi:mono/diheme cytochrome c family protein
MPPWKRILKDDQISGVLDYVVQNFSKEPFKELKTRNIPNKNPVAASADSTARGEQMFLLRCSGCHGRKADGKGPNSLDILPHPRFQVLNYGAIRERHRA